MNSTLKVSSSRQFDLVKSRAQLAAEKRRKSERAKLKRKEEAKKKKKNKKKGKQLIDADSLLEGMFDPRELEAYVHCMRATSKSIFTTPKQAAVIVAEHELDMMLTHTMILHFQQPCFKDLF